MKFFEQMNRLERLDQLIRMKATGNPKSLANRLNLSERRIYDLINIMKELGAPIQYCNERNSYYYQFEGSLKCAIKFELTPKPNAMGGQLWNSYEAKIIDFISDELLQKKGLSF